MADPSPHARRRFPRGVVLQDGARLGKAKQQAPSRTPGSATPAACLSIHIGIHAAMSLVSNASGGATSARPVAQVPRRHRTVCSPRVISHHCHWHGMF